jgi:hypothetical protein
MLIGSLATVIATGSLAGNVSRSASSSRPSRWTACALARLDAECLFVFFKSPLLLSQPLAGKAQTLRPIYHGSAETQAFAKLVTRAIAGAAAFS